MNIHIKEFFTASNLLSFFRLLLSVPMAVFLVNGMTTAVVVCFALAYISDLLDGVAARKLGQITETGKIIDPLADKVFVGTAALVLILNGTVPLWFGIIVLGRDFLILTAGLLSARKLGYVLQSNWAGKITVVLIAIAFIGMYLEIEFLDPWILYFTAAAMIVSLVIYGVVMVKRLRENSENH